MTIKHTGLFYQTVANMGMVHGHRELTAEGQQKLYEAYARLELEFCRLPEFVSPEVDRMQQAAARVPRIQAVGMGRGEVPPP